MRLDIEQITVSEAPRNTRITPDNTVKSLENQFIFIFGIFLLKSLYFQRVTKVKPSVFGVLQENFNLSFCLISAILILLEQTTLHKI